MTVHFRIEKVFNLYNGFFITHPVGNNAFSWKQRKNKKIRVAPLINGTIADLQVSNDIVFSEIEDQRELNRPGLEKFVRYRFEDKEIFFFDNHNHAFFFWYCWFVQGCIPPNAYLLHVDQHSDLRQPEDWFPGISDLNTAFEYTNYKLNVGNFIRPAQKAGFFSKAEIINSTAGFASEWPVPFLLDLDMDIFAPELNYIPKSDKIKQIRKWVKQSRLITVATSPFFTDQQLAIDLIRQIFE